MVVMMVLSQLPSVHSLGFTFFSLAYTYIVVSACNYAGLLKNVPSRDYSLESSEFSVVMGAFTSISMFAAVFGNVTVSEIQVTLAPPVTGKMFKGLMMCYIVIFVTFCSALVTGTMCFAIKLAQTFLRVSCPMRRLP
ncbi:hypothetical protein QVD17_17346 [Tagetes erecta]|uniref:Amino acid transporter transmembrane domain-containing protein n=1 Tax=Tagetes erecta TaxID=13708 RepID=A0AAD8KWN2_TARER|nr:hypothetical protein QVD17_17346 [Tagetes erecta]